MTAEADAVESVRTIIVDGWTSSNTDSITPDFYIEGEQPLRLDHSNVPTSIMVYPVSHIIMPNDLGSNHKIKTVDVVSLDIRTMESRDHLINSYNEIRRIFSDKVNNPDSDFAQWLDLRKASFIRPNFFRYVYDVQLTNWVASR